MSSRGKKTAPKPKASRKSAKIPKKHAKPAPKKARPAARPKPPAKAAARPKPSARPAAKASRRPAAPARPPVPVRSAPVSRPPPKPVAKAPSPVPPPAPRSLPPMVARRPPLPPPPASRPPPPKVSTFARSYYWSDLRVGDDLPPLARPPIDRVQIVRYAAAANDLNRLYVDEPYAQALGFVRGAFAPGPLVLGFMGQLLSAWLKKGHVRKLSGRFVKLVWPGDELTCRGRIAELRREKGVCTADIELWAENQKGELVLRGQATCELLEAPPPGTGGFLASLDARLGRSAQPRPAPAPFRRR